MNVDSNANDIENRLKKLEQLQRNTRIAIIIIVGYFIYDAISRDSGSDIVYAHKIKAKQFELVDGAGTVYGTWRRIGDTDPDSILSLSSVLGSELKISSTGITISADRTRSGPSLSITAAGVDTRSNSVQSVEKGDNYPTVGQ